MKEVIKLRFAPSVGLALSCGAGHDFKLGFSVFSRMHYYSRELVLGRAGREEAEPKGN